MSDYIERARGLEDSYNGLVKTNPNVLEAIELRNTGWDDAFKNGDRGTGIMLLERSAKLLEAGGEEFTSERYATAARTAQALCVDGKFDRATESAKTALGFELKGYEHTQTRTLADFGPVGSPARMNAEFDIARSLTTRIVMPDQYRIIFGGRLSLVLAASMTEGDLRFASELAAEARKLAPLSEDPTRVVFIDKEMAEERRIETRFNFGRIARVASITAHAPITLGMRRKIAQRVCAR